MFSLRPGLLRQSAIVAVMMMFFSAAARAQPAGDDGRVPVDDGDQCVLRTYEVGDLVLNVPDYPYPGSSGSIQAVLGGFSGGGGGTAAPAGMGGMGGMGGGFMQVRDTQAGGGAGGLGMGGLGMGGGGLGGNAAPSSAPVPSNATPQITMENLTEVLVTVIAPDTWSEYGGPGELQHLGTALVVRQTEPVHREIEDLLDQLRKGSGTQKTVAIEARWLLLDSDDLEQLMLAGEDGRPRIDRQILADFTRRPTSIRGMTNCFSGQLVYLVSGTRRNVVTSFVPVVGSLERPNTLEYATLQGGARVLPAQTFSSSRAVGYQPVIATPNLGALLQIRPTLIPGEERAIVDVHSTLTVLGKPSDSEAAVRVPEDRLVPSVDRVAIETQELATTLSAPLGAPVLAGGLTYIGPTTETCGKGGDSAETPESERETPQLYLVLELH